MTRDTTRNNLLALMNLPSETIDRVCRTSDGYYMAQLRGDIGYNHFLGQPNPPHEGPGRDAMLKVWASLALPERKDVLALAQNPGDGSPILLHEDFGVPRLARPQLTLP